MCTDGPSSLGSTYVGLICVPPAGPRSRGGVIQTRSFVDYGDMPGPKAEGLRYAAAGRALVCTMQWVVLHESVSPLVDHSAPSLYMWSVLVICMAKLN